MRPLLLVFISFSILAINLKATPTFNNDTGEIPFEMIKNKIIITVQIQGEAYRFILDTGGGLMVSERLQKIHQFSIVGDVIVGDVNKNKATFDRVLVPEVQVGAWTFKDRKAVVDVFSDQYPFSCLETDGMIGRDFFQEAILHFDYSKKIIRLTQNRADFTLDNKQQGKFKLKHDGIPYFETIVDGKKRYIEFDSGSGDVFSFGNADVPKLKSKNDEEILTLAGVFSFGAAKLDYSTSERYMVKVEELSLAGIQFNNFYSQISKPSQARFGAGLLKYGTLTIDFQENRFYFSPYSNTLPTSFETFGFDLTKINGVYVVKWVMKGSAADKAGIQFGQKILAVNGKAIASYVEDCEGYINGYPFLGGEELSVELEQENKEKMKLSLKKINLK